MTAPPARPKIYHITHVDNLASIVSDGCLFCDREIVQRGGPPAAIGIPPIKRRRIEELQVSCHPGTRVGDYVPFYFCPRSVMLYVIHCGNRPELIYRRGQGEIVHLEADLYRAIDWADAHGVRWAFSLSNAGARYAEFRAGRRDLQELDWDAIRARDFRDRAVQERKQAEFLLHDRCPLDLVERIGVHSEPVRARVQAALERARWAPVVAIRRDWYF